MVIDTKTKLLIYSSPIEPNKQIRFINSFLEHYEKNVVCFWRNLSFGMKEIISYLISIEAIGIIFPEPKPLQSVKSIVSSDRLIVDKLTERMNFYDVLFLEGNKIAVYNSMTNAFRKFIDINFKDKIVYYDIDSNELKGMFELISLFNENVKEWKPGIHLKDDDILFKTANNKPYSKNDIIVDDLNNQGKLGYYILFHQLTNHYKEIDFENFLEGDGQKHIRENFCIIDDNTNKTNDII
jgi:hypothetical protein